MEKALKQFTSLKSSSFCLKSFSLTLYHFFGGLSWGSQAFRLKGLGLKQNSEVVVVGPKQEAERR